MIVVVRHSDDRHGAVEAEQPAQVARGREVLPSTGSPSKSGGDPEDHRPRLAGNSSSTAANRRGDEQRVIIGRRAMRRSARGRCPCLS